MVLELRGSFRNSENADCVSNARRASLRAAAPPPATAVSSQQPSAAAADCQRCPQTALPIAAAWPQERERQALDDAARAAQPAAQRGAIALAGAGKR